MTRYAIDPATLLALIEHPIDPAHSLVAPNSIRSDALDLLLGQVRTGAVTERTALELHERLTGVKLRLLGDRVSRRTAWNLAREHDWPTLRHAEYIAIARLQADALIATDAELLAQARGLVPLAQLPDLMTPG